MAGYWVPKKNRCGCLDCSGSSCNSFNVVYVKSKSGSLFSQLKSSKTAYVAGNLEPTSEKLSIKSNVRKHGSGGNSYAAYLARKVGATQIKETQPSCLKCV